MKPETNVFTEFLSQLHVPHTYAYSRDRFESMAFKSFFGLKKLLAEYKVESNGYRLPCPEEMLRLPTPYLAKSPGGIIIVTGFDADRQEVEYLSEGVAERIAAAEFTKVMPGIVFMAFPSPDSEEPDYKLHRRDILFSKGKEYLLMVLALFIVGYLWIAEGLYRHVSMYFIALLDIAGIYISTLLLQKSLRIHNPAADKVCKIIQDGGCDSVLKTDASTFFGIFSWSEVGFSYFVVSLLCLLVFPQYLGYLALCNVCCLPFSFWSVWYQKTKAKAWCTLCLCVQALLWLLFACYLFSGAYSTIFPLRIELVVLIASYAFTLLTVNRIATKFENTENV